MEIVKDNKTAILFGATGFVGRFLLDFLLMHGAYKEVIVFTRREIEIESPKLKQHVIDFEKIDKYKDLIFGDDLFWALGTTIKKAGSQEKFFQVDFAYSLKTAKIAQQNCVNQFLLVSSVGANADSFFFYSRVKGQLEDSIKAVSFWAIHIFQPSVLLGKRNENRWGEKLAAQIGKRFDLLSGGMLTKYKPIEAEIVAQAMVSAAQRLKKGIHTYPSNLLQQLADEEYG
ncbi:MAG: NAD(P)H-binding protein [Bacteroidetes bacterium]|nr:NAD(P)H-binding protein [Bacteroidota bacterium]